MLKIILITIAALIAIALIGDISRSLILFQKARTLANNASPFERKAPGANQRILVLGDSTAYGVGAEKPKLSTAGRLASLYPEAELVNLAVSGLRIEGLNQILSDINEEERYDIVLIQIGANDIIRQTPMQEIKAGIEKVLERAEKFGGQVVVLHSGDIGQSKFFPWVLRPLMSSRSREVREIYMQVADFYSARYVDLMNSPSDKLLEENPEVYYAADYLHLSGAGYGLWFKEIEKQLLKNIEI